MTYNRYMATAHLLQAQAYRAYALAASLDHNTTEDDRRKEVDHYAALSAQYDGIASDYLQMETKK